MQPKMRKVLTNKRLISIAGLILLAIVSLQISFYLFPLPKKGLLRPSSTLVFGADNQLMRAFTSSDEMWRIRSTLDQISPTLRKFLITYEDRWFYKHPGINPLAIGRAVIQNLQARTVVSGGSTITMQIARMMEPKERTVKNKLIEAFRALQLEHFYSKQELLEIYFNIAPYGGNIEGAAAASWMYFGKEPTQLSDAEAALLAALPNNPSYLRPDLHPEAARQARDKVLARMVQYHALDETGYAEALKEPVPGKRREWPFIAPHFTTDMRLRAPKESRIYTTIHVGMQQLAENLLAAHIRGLKNDGISNGAVVVIDNQTHELKVLVGSQNFFNEADSGQVNGATAPRSPGSALKPFLYALGLTQGVVTPAMALEDVPIDYSGYVPENYDRQFNGTVTMREALERSLNVPAVNLYSALYRRENLHDFLRKAEVSTIHEVNDYGLTLVLGGCEVTLYELTSLYSVFANGGNLYKPRELQSQPGREAIQLIDPGTAFIITDILSGIRRPDLPAVWEFTTLPRVSWKTGTSFGHRDAWSIGYNPLYTVGVWIGNFSGEGSPAIVGANVAGPLLFDLFTELSRNKQFTWFTRPEMVAERQVCSVSGQLPGAYCTTTVTEYYLTDRSPVTECEYHKLVLIDETTGYRLPLGFKTDHPVKEAGYIKWPQRVATWRIKNGYPVYQLPEFDPGLQRQISGKAPAIQSPLANMVYLCREGVSLDYQKIAFIASVSNDVQRIYWFIDGHMVGSVKPGEKFFYLPEPGKHKVICQDDLGRMMEMEMVVE